MKSQKEIDILNGKESAGSYYVHKFSKEYDRIMKLADKQCPSPCASNEKMRGRPKLGKERSLIERLKDLKVSVMRFYTNYNVPFDNNLAERDLRNCKTKSKVSGCFRSLEGAQHYLDISSYINRQKEWNQCI